MIYPIDSVIDLLNNWDQRPVSRKSRELFGLGELFCVCCIYTQDPTFNNFNNDTMKLSVNKANLTGL